MLFVIFMYQSIAYCSNHKLSAVNFFDQNLSIADSVNLMSRYILIVWSCAFIGFIE